MNILTEKFPHLVHGADYNPDQWFRYPEVFEQDIELLKKAHMNSVSLGIFSWSHLEPKEGEYDFTWMAHIIDKLYENGIYTLLATPSGAKPLWMSEKYEEIRRVDKDGVRAMSGQRHNHCYTSPIYREKTTAINTKLAEKFASHPGVIMWHISNEYNGECYCPLCQEAFREYLKDKYKTIDNLNHAWWTDFWSHNYSDWSQINAPMNHGEKGVHALNLEWKRFVTKQTFEFIKVETDAVKSINPDIPVTTNLMGIFQGLDYFKLKDYLDVVSVDNYPMWHKTDNILEAVISASAYDLVRCIKNKNFFLMENTPAQVNWRPICQLKKPGMHKLSAVQGLAHGSESIQYFQFRKSRGSCEKLHGAVVDHVGHENTRVFRDVAEVGVMLEKLSNDIYGTQVKSDVAIIYDWDNTWAIDDCQGPINKPSYNNEGMGYTALMRKHYAEFWKKGINVDVISVDAKLDNYKVVVLPMLYMFKNGIQDRLREFTANGGTILTTYNSGIVNETDLCFLSGWPGDMRDVFGVWNEEIDALWEDQSNTVKMCEPYSGTYVAKKLCALLNLEGAKPLAVYDSDFYKGTPALTCNDYGKGKAYYLATDCETDMLTLVYEHICKEANVQGNLLGDLPYGVTAQSRIGDRKYIFVQNYNNFAVEFELQKEYEIYTTDQKGEKIKSIKLPEFGTMILVD